MHILVQKSALLTAATLARSAAVAKSINTSLQCLLLRATSEGLTLTGTDATIRLSTPCDANVKIPGEIAIDAANLVQVLKVLPDEVIDLDVGENFRATLKCGRSTYKLSGVDPSTFTPAPPPIDDEGIAIDAADLRKMLDQTLFQVADADDKYGLNGLHLDPVDTGTLRAVGTDGNRLGWSQCPYTGTLNIGRRMLIPRAAVERLRGLIDGATGPVSLAFSARAGVARVGGAVMDFRLLEAEFPDYKAVLPTRFERTVIADRTALIDTLRRVMVFASDGSRSIRFDFSADSIVLSARKADAGDSRDECPCELTGEPIKMGVNGRFMLDVLNACTANQVRLQLGTVLAPVLIQGWDGANPDPNALFVVMPVRLD